MLYISAYCLPQFGMLDGNGWHYVLIKLAPSILVLWSLAVDFNLSSALIQVIWMLLRVRGLMHRRPLASTHAMAMRDHVAD